MTFAWLGCYFEASVDPRVEWVPVNNQRDDNQDLIASEEVRTRIFIIIVPIDLFVGVQCFKRDYKYVDRLIALYILALEHTVGIEYVEIQKYNFDWYTFAFNVISRVKIRQNIIIAHQKLKSLNSSYALHV